MTMSHNPQTLQQPGGSPSDDYSGAKAPLGSGGNNGILSNLKSQAAAIGSAAGLAGSHFAEKAKSDAISQIEKKNSVRDRVVACCKGLLSGGKRKAMDDQDASKRPVVQGHRVTRPTVIETNFFSKRPKIHSRDSPHGSLMKEAPRASMEPSAGAAKPDVIDLCQDDSDTEGDHQTKWDASKATEEHDQPVSKSDYWKKLEVIPKRILAQKSAQSQSNSGNEDISGTAGTLKYQDFVHFRNPSESIDGTLQRVATSRPLLSTVAAKVDKQPEDCIKEGGITAMEEGKQAGTASAKESNSAASPYQHSLDVETQSVYQHEKRELGRLLIPEHKPTSLLGSKTSSCGPTIREVTEEAVSKNHVQNSKIAHHIVKDVKITEPHKTPEKSRMATANAEIESREDRNKSSHVRNTVEVHVSTEDDRSANRNEVIGTLTEHHPSIAEQELTSETGESMNVGHIDANAENEDTRDNPIRINNEANNAAGSRSQFLAEATSHSDETNTQMGILVPLSLGNSAEERPCVEDGEISLGAFCALSVLFIGLVISLRWLHLSSLSNAILLEFLRGTFQLIVVGSSFAFLLKFGNSQPTAVLGYVLLVTAMASQEVMTRTKYTYDGQFYHIFASIALSVIGIGGFALTLISNQQPFWNPKFALPIACLLLGSCINGVSLALDSINTALVEEMGEVQMLLVFGASKDESSQHLITSCLQKGLSSVRGMLRSMGTSGIVPMLMCGQILSGTPAKQATLHQITIAILVCLSTFSSVYLSSLAAVNSAFDSAQMFQVDHFIRNRNRSFVGLLWVLGSFFGRVEVLSNSAVSRRISESHEFYIGKSITSTFEANGDPNCSSSVVLEVSDLFLEETLSPNESALVDGSVSHWSLNLHLGEVIEIGGGSNVVESRLFFTLAGHRSFQGGELRLASEPWLQFGSSDWRKRVLFVPPGNPRLHGTPLQFLRRVSSFRTQINNELSVQENFSAMIDRISDSLFQWGLDLDCLGTDWKDLSDEEGYLVLLASALASQPKVLLIQDLEVLSSAARDGVDRSILQFAQERGGSVLLMPAENQESS